MSDSKASLAVKDDLWFGLAGAVTLPAVTGYIFLVSMRVPNITSAWVGVLGGTCIFMLIVWILALRMFLRAAWTLLSAKLLKTNPGRPS